MGQIKDALSKKRLDAFTQNQLHGSIVTALKAIKEEDMIKIKEEAYNKIKKQIKLGNMREVAVSRKALVDCDDYWTPSKDADGCFVIEAFLKTSIVFDPKTDFEYYKLFFSTWNSSSLKEFVRAVYRYIFAQDRDIHKIEVGYDFLPDDQQSQIWKDWKKEQLTPEPKKLESDNLRITFYIRNL